MCWDKNQIILYTQELIQYVHSTSVTILMEIKFYRSYSNLGTQNISLLGPTTSGEKITRVHKEDPLCEALPSSAPSSSPQPLCSANLGLSRPQNKEGVLHPDLPFAPRNAAAPAIHSTSYSLIPGVFIRVSPALLISLSKTPWAKTCSNS